MSLTKIMPNQLRSLYRPLRAVCVLLLLLGFAQPGYSQDGYNAFSVLGTSQAMCKPGIESGEELQAFFRNNPDMVADVLASANWQGDSRDLFEAVAAGDFTEGLYEPGTTFEWTGLQEDGVGKHKPRRVWAGEEAFAGFELNVTSQGQVHTIVIPKACCNVSLMGSTDVPVEEPVAVVEEPVAAAEPEAEPEPEPIAAAPSLIPYIGLYAGDETRMLFEPVWDMYMEDGTNVYGILAGLMKPLGEDWMLFGQLGFADRDGVSQRNLAPNDTIFVDIGVDRYFGPGFIGAGVGLWHIADDDFEEGSILIHGGSDLGQTNIQLYGEARVFMDDLDDIESNNLLTIGVRYLFR